MPTAAPIDPEQGPPAEDAIPTNEAGLRSASDEIALLNEVGRIVSSDLELTAAFQKVMTVISARMRMHRGTLILLDEASGRLRTVAAVGLTPDEISKNKFALGEGITGHVVATGRPRIIKNVLEEPDFLNRTNRLRYRDDRTPVSYFCIPIRIEEKPVGALAIDKRFITDEQVDADFRFLDVITSFLAQAIQINRMLLTAKEQLVAEAHELRSQLRDRYKFENIIGDSAAMNEVFSTVAQVATSRATVLLLGETGTGKEMIAKAIHYNSDRAEKPFIRVNCGAIAGTLLESELFGHVKGSFTGAIKDKPGKFEAADGGTIFLDEIGTMEPQLQVKLLRVLQEREFERVGDNESMKVDVRVIAATNVDLEEEVAKNDFREDLYYRLNVVSIYLPPLRNRREDIPKLIDYFLDRFNGMNGRNLRRMSRETLNLMLRYPWPGNVRELENSIERAVVLSQSEDFTDDLLPLGVRMYAQQRRGGDAESIDAIANRLAEQAIAEFGIREGEIYSLVIDKVEGSLIEKALVRTEGVKTKAADFLGINRNTLNKKVKDLGVEAD
ncbi:MAG: sigma 54-interacting transcriptional regulator [Planctomycetota bacterium]